MNAPSSLAPAGNPHRIPVARWCVAAVLSATIALLLAVAIAAFHVPFAVALSIAVAISMACVPWLAKRLPVELEAIAARHRVYSALWMLLAVAAVLRTAGVALYMADPAMPQASAFWFDAFYTHHSCFSGYWQAATLAADRVDNLYDPQHYTGFFGAFKIDEFLYLPQFLILPEIATTLGLSFEQVRALWFTLEGGTVLAGMLAVSLWIGGTSGRNIGLLIPAVWITSPNIVTLQLGNFHLSAVVLSIVAMALFWRNRPIAGGALLGFTVFKLFPGILGIYLIASRRWRALAWTLGFSSLYTVIAYVWFGISPFRALFGFHLPRLASGEAWSFLQIPELAPVAHINDSIPGIVVKLESIGLPGMTLALEQPIAWLWTAFVAGLTVFSALRAPRLSRREITMHWLALLALAAFRSPFVPDHTGLFAPIWLWSLVAAGAVAGRSRPLLHAALWLMLGAVLPFGGTPLDAGPARLIVSSLSQVIAVWLCLSVLLRSPSGQADAEQGNALPSPSGHGRKGDTSDLAAA